MKKWILLSLLLGACQNNTLSERIASPEQFNDAIVGGIEVPATDPLAFKALSLKVLSDPVEVRKTDAVHITYKAAQCTASAIAPRILLTAAHCISPKATLYRLEVPTGNGKVSIYKGIKAVIHPNYPERKDADLAMILLEVALPENIQIMKLPAIDKDLNLTTLIAAGFGRVNGKQSAPGFPGKLRATNLNVVEYSPTEATFETDQTNGKGICQGDSGGPGMLDIQGQTYVVGVVARTSYEPSADGDHDFCNHRGIYINVQFFMKDWILPTMTNLSKE